MNEHRNTTATIRAVLKSAEDAGVVADQILYEADIPKDLAFDPDGEVTLPAMKAFWETAYRLTKDPYLAMNAGVHAAHGTYKTLDYLMLVATTPGEGLSRFIEHFRLINTWLHFAVEETDSDVQVVLRSQIGPVPFPAVELTFSVITERFRQMLGNRWTPVAVDFLHTPSGEPGFYNGFFRCPVSFGQDTARISFDRAEWDSPLPTSNEGLFRVLADHAALLSAAKPMPDDLVARASQEVVRTLSTGVPEVEDVADTLGVSLRTLQRRLSDRATSFSNLVDQARKDQAISLVSSGTMSLSEIAFFLGFSDQSAFTRAFKRWTDATPRDFRLTH